MENGKAMAQSRVLSDGWRDVNTELPDASKYDWVLVQCIMIPEGYCGVPHIAEFRRGHWYNNFIDEPFEKHLSVKVIAWMPLPAPPAFA